MTFHPTSQCWERHGLVLVLHPVVDPNVPGVMTGWVKVSEQRAREVLAAQQNRNEHAR